MYFRSPLMVVDSSHCDPLCALNHDAAFLPQVTLSVPRAPETTEWCCWPARVWRSWKHILITDGMRSRHIIMVALPEDTYIFLLLCPPTYGETQGDANLCSLDQYPITFTYLVVLRVREAHRTGPSRECECSTAASLQLEGMCVGFTLQISQNFHLI